MRGKKEASALSGALRPERNAVKPKDGRAQSKGAVPYQNLVLNRILRLRGKNRRSAQDARVDYWE